jgi:hypothetical protein
LSPTLAAAIVRSAAFAVYLSVRFPNGVVFVKVALAMPSLPALSF